MKNNWFVKVLVLVIIINTCSNQKYMLELEVNKINLSEISDGDYFGEYKKYRWFCNVQVSVINNKIDTIIVLKSANGTKKLNKTLTDRIIEKQSLHINAVSGATITSKTYLKAVENALVN